MATLDRPEGLENELPRAVLQRLVKSAIPSGVGISKDAKTAFGVAAQIFVSYCTATANEIASEGKKKTLGADDVLEAIKAMDFQEFLEPLQASLKAYREEQQEKKEQRAKARAKKEKLAAEAAAAAPGGATDEGDDTRKRERGDGDDDDGNDDGNDGASSAGAAAPESKVPRVEKEDGGSDDEASENGE